MIETILYITGAVILAYFAIVVVANCIAVYIAGKVLAFLSIFFD